MISSIASIVSAVKKIKEKDKYSIYRDDKNICKVDKEEASNWLEQERCQMCGNSSGEEEGICDECRWL